MNNLKETLTGHNISKDMNIIVKFANDKIDGLEEAIETVEAIGENVYNAEYVQEILFDLREKTNELKKKFDELKMEEQEEAE